MGDPKGKSGCLDGYEKADVLEGPVKMTSVGVIGIKNESNPNESVDDPDKEESRDLIF